MLEVQRVPPNASIPSSLITDESFVTQKSPGALLSVETHAASPLTDPVTFPCLLPLRSWQVLEGQCVLPKRAQELGFQFKYPTLHEALVAIFKSS